MKRILLISLTGFLLLSYTASISQPSKYEGKIVKRIFFQGLDNLNEDDLLYVMKTTVGYPLKALEVRDDIKKVFEKGKFESIVVEIEEYMDGVQLKFICKERPVIKSIKFKGNDELSETDLTGVIPLKEGEVIRKDYLENSVKRIKEKYDDEGLFNAVVRYKIEDVKGRGGDVRVTFIIDEGEEIKIRKISILGAKKINPKELSGIMESSEEGLFKDGAFKREVYEEDKAKIIAYYRQYGYLDAEILEDSVEYEWLDPEKKEKRGIYVTVKVSEGELYYFDSYTIKIVSRDAEPVFTQKELMDELEQNRSGKVFNDTLFQKDRQAIGFKYATKGYIFARVIPKRTITEREVEVKKGKTEKRKFVAIDFEIEEGTQAYIDMIIIKGNKKTKDKVIRRELAFTEGELFDSRKMQISREKVYNLGFFKEVNIDVRPGSREGYMNLIIDVVEQPTGTISLGGGYGTTSGFSIFADVAENNLLGNGQRVGVRFEYGPEKTAVSVSFMERWLFNKPIGLSTSIFYNLYNVETGSTVFPAIDDVAEYKKEAIGYSLGLSYRFLHHFTTGTTWTHAFTRVKDPTGNASDEIFKAASFKYQEKRSLTFYILRDSRDNYLNPTSGSRIEFAATFTGGAMLGGEDHYIQWDPQMTFYFSPFHLPLLKSHPCVFELRASGTFITKPFLYKQVRRKQSYQAYRVDLRNPWLEPEDRLNIGGPETLRGWDYYDSRFPTSWQDVGLFHRILWGVEFRVPIHPQMLWLAFFLDAGSLWSDKFWEQHLTVQDYKITLQDISLGDLYRLDDMGNKTPARILSYFRYSYGFGFRIQIPMMPLRFWFGRKFIYNGGFKHLGGFTFQFAIGDVRF